MAIFTNECSISGLVYDFGKFGVKERPDGSISGSLMILTDPKNETVVEVNFIPQKPVYKSGKENTTYEALKQLMETKATVANVGEKKAAKVRCTCRVSTNIYFMASRSKHDEMEQHETLQYSGSFLHIDENAQPYMGFNMDCVIASVVPCNQDEPNGEQRVRIKFYDDYYHMFRFANMKVVDPAGIAVFQREVEDQPYYATISGTVVNHVVEKREDSSAMEFGAAAVTATPRAYKDTIITGVTPRKEYPFSEDEDKESANNRKEFLANRLKAAQEKANKTSSAVAPKKKLSVTDF